MILGFQITTYLWQPNFDVLSGVSFLPMDEHTYKQAPYQEITEAEYHEWVSKMPASINWSDLSFYEVGDNTSGSQELACVSGYCEVVEIGTSR